MNIFLTLEKFFIKKPLSGIIKIVVLSDIHFDQSNDSITAQEVLLESLINCDFSYLIVNGDVTKGGQKAGFIQAKDFFLKLLERKKESNFSINNIFFVVGNHDCDIAEITKIIESEEYKDFFKKHRKNIHDNGLRNKFLTKELHLEKFEPIFREYISFLKELGVPKYENPYLTNEDHWLKYLTGYRDINENIIFFANNSCWYSHPEARGKLALASDIVKVNSDILQQETKDSNKIIISSLHHEISHLHWEERNKINCSFKKILEVSDVILTSDQHEPLKSPDYLESNNLLVITGSVYDSINYPNSYKVLSIDQVDKSLTIDEYTSNHNGQKYTFEKVKPIEVYYDESKKRKKYLANASYEGRHFPFKLNLKNRVSLDEELFWENNEELSKNIFQESRDDLIKIESILVNKFNQEFNTTILKSKDRKNRVGVYEFRNFCIYFVNVGISFLEFKEIKDQIQDSQESDLQFIITPYSLIKSRHTLAIKRAEYYNDYLDNLKKEMNFKNTFFRPVQFLSFSEISETVNNKELFLFNKKVKMELENIK